MSSAPARWRLRSVLAVAIAAVVVAVAGIAGPAQAGTKWLQVDAGHSRACAIRSDHTLWCWGYAQGFLTERTDTGAYYDRPHRVGKDSGWASVNAGFMHACALSIEGTLYCWGSNSDGELGLGDVNDHYEPTQVTMIDDGSGVQRPGARWKSISAGTGFTCGITVADELACWGDNYDGQLGLGHYNDVATPTVVGTGWSSVSTGMYRACGIKKNGTRYCWGLNFQGQLGVGDKELHASPARRDGEKSWDWTSVSVGSGDSCGIRSNGALYCWHGSFDDISLTTPKRVGTHNWAAVEAGQGHNCGLYPNGARHCWGDNDAGQLGLGDTDDRDVPRRRKGESAWASVTLGYRFSCGLRPSGAVYCWGTNWRGQLGVGDTEDRHLPTRV